MLGYVSSYPGLASLPMCRFILKAVVKLWMVPGKGCTDASVQRPSPRVIRLPTTLNWPARIYPTVLTQLVVNSSLSSPVRLQRPFIEVTYLC